MLHFIHKTGLGLILGATLCSAALAAPVLVNGGFENNPPSGFGNNIGHPIAPWVLGGGDSSNVVKVDGGARNYGNVGPAFDATAPGVGVDQHYLDIANGANDFYQEFTPLCDGRVEYGAYFSRRPSGAVGIAGITLLQSTDSSAVAPRQEVSLALGTPRSDPWTRVAFQATLTANTAYKFFVDMDNDMNMDNAFVVFLDQCDLHDAPDFGVGIPDTTPDTVEAGITKTCGDLVETDAGLQSECTISISMGDKEDLDVADYSRFLMVSEALRDPSGAKIPELISAFSGAGWLCSPAAPPFANDEVPSCILPYESMPSDGVMTLSATVVLPANQTGTWENCASLSQYDFAAPVEGYDPDAPETALLVFEALGGAGGPAGPVRTNIGEGCTPIALPIKRTEVSKTCAPVILSEDNSGASTGTLDCKITVTHGEESFRNIDIEELFTGPNGPMGSTIVGLTSNDAWACSSVPPASDLDAVSCTMTAADMPQSGVTTIDVKIEIAVDDLTAAYENCAAASGTVGPAEPGTAAAPTLTDLVVQDLGKACVPVVFETAPPKPDTPKPVQCTPFTGNVTCDSRNGGYSVTLSNSLSGQFDPTLVDVTVLTAGVTAAANANNPLKLLLSGASAGDTVQMSLAATQNGAGSEPGLDLCCMGEISVTIPKDLICDQPPAQSVLNVTKTCEPTAQGFGAGNTVCHMDVTYSGPAPTSANPITVTDSIASGSGIISINAQDPTGNTRDVWACSGFGAGPVSCAMHNGIDTTNTPNYWQSYSTTLDLYLDTKDEYRNCATASVTLKDGTVAKVEDCFSKADTQLEIVKSAKFELCTPGDICQFEYTVNNLGTADYNGAITLNDTVTPVGGSFFAIAPALCNAADLSTVAGCTGTTTIPAGGSVTYTVDYAPPFVGGEGALGDQGKNCVALTDKTMGQFDDPAKVEGHTSCVDFKIGKPRLTLEKVLNGACLPNQICDFDINIISTGAAYNGNIVLADAMGGTGGMIVSTSPPLPAGCSLPASTLTCVMPVSVPAGGVYTLSVQASYTDLMQEDDHNRNCAIAVFAPATAELGSIDENDIPAWAEAAATIGQSCVPLTTPDSIPEFELVKSCEAIAQASNNGDVPLTNLCTITLTNVLGTSFEGDMSVGDVVSVTGFGQEVISEFACGAGFTGPGSENTCVANETSLAGNGQQATINVTLEFPAWNDMTDAQMAAMQSGQNCTTVVDADGATVASEFCTPISVPEFEECGPGMVMDEFGHCIVPAQPEVTVGKTCSAPVFTTENLATYGYLVECQIVLSTTAPVTEPFEFMEQVSGPDGNNNGVITAITSSDGWDCVRDGSMPQLSANDPIVCNNSAALPFMPFDTSVLTVQMLFDPAMGNLDLGNTDGWQNCAISATGETCASIVFPKLSVEKTCDPASYTVGVDDTIDLSCQIAVTGSGFADGQEIEIFDSLTGTAVVPNLIGTPTSSAGPCTVQYGLVNCAFDSTLLNQAGGTFVTDVTMSIDNPSETGNLRNCAMAKLAGGLPAAESCATITIIVDETPPVPENVDVALLKSFEHSPVIQGLGRFTLVPSFVSGGLQIGDVVVITDMFGSNAANVLATGGAGAWVCNAVNGTAGVECSATVTANGMMPLGQPTLDVQVGSGWENCATLAVRRNGTNLVDPVGDNNTSCAVAAPDSAVSTTASVTKACVAQPRLGSTLTYVCNITVMTDGTPPDGDLVIDDVMTLPSLADANAALGAFVGNTAGLVCTTAPYTSVNAPSCSISPADLALAQNTVSMTAVIVGAPTSFAAPGSQNCAIAMVNEVAIGGPACHVFAAAEEAIDADDDGFPQGQDCDDMDPNVHPGAAEILNGMDDNCDGEIDENLVVPTAIPSPPQLAVTKALAAQCKVSTAAQTYTCDFELTVTNVGGAPYIGPIALDDRFGEPKPFDISAIGEGWECLRSDGLGTNCLKGDANLGAGQSTSVTMTTIMPSSPNGAQFENCVSIGVGESDFLQASVIQTVMQRLGIDGGPVDGAPGPQTRAGIRTLQERLKLAPTGDIDAALFAALGLGTAETAQPSCITVDLPPVERPVVCAAPQVKNSKGVCYTPRVDCADGQVKNSKGRCYTPRAETPDVSCKKGQVKNSKGQCYTPKKDTPKAGASCDARSTVQRGSDCACRYSNMRKSSATACVCQNTGLSPIRGLGCPSIKIGGGGHDTPDKPSGSGDCKLELNGICLSR